MMGLLEHASIIAQVFLAFGYAHALWGLLAIIIWAVYIVLQYLFYRDFTREVVQKDLTYRKWTKDKANAMSVKVISCLGTYISWGFYKLLYSHFYGYSIKTTDFEDSKKYQAIMWKYTLLTICAVYAPLFLLNFICLLTITWGNQLYIELIENMIIAVLMTICTIIEHRLMLGSQAND